MPPEPGSKSCDVGLDFDAVIVGAGFAGMYMLHRLRGLGLSTLVLEAGADVGGTWYWNRYPGARCDVESMQYSFSFSREIEQSWQWKERYASQSEILDYARHIADRLDLRGDIRFETRVTAADFNEENDSWTVYTNRGDIVSARFCVMATGCLSSAKLPEINARDSFRGHTYHTGTWPHDRVEFTGQSVGIIGTGSSAIQAIPLIAAQADNLFIFQRTPNYSVPAHNRPMSADEERDWKTHYPERRRLARNIRNGIFLHLNNKSALDASEAERLEEYEARWQVGGIPFMAAFNDLYLNERANETAADFVRAKIRSIVRDPATAEMLVPKDYPIGTKRICVDSDYFETFNRANVTLVDVRAAPIEAITPEGVRTCRASYNLDSIVFATGFDAMTGTLQAMRITGRAGQTLWERWAEGPRTYLGLMVAGFPNLFTITGPGSPSVLSNMIVSIEQHVDWIADCIVELRGRGAVTIEAEVKAEEDWVTHVREVAERTLFPRANSWYVGANVPGKPRVVMPYIGGVPEYRRKCDDIAARGYQGLKLKA
jgi:cyclohexanone monooxygenase